MRSRLYDIEQESCPTEYLTVFHAKSYSYLIAYQAVVNDIGANCKQIRHLYDIVITSFDDK